jgi:hypothetical protein
MKLCFFKGRGLYMRKPFDMYKLLEAIDKMLKE